MRNPVALLETKGLSKSFGGVQALQDVDVHIEEGSIHGLIGPNGSGMNSVFQEPSSCSGFFWK